MIDYCYHTHTSRCGHAYGEDEEYVVSAINHGFKVVGFSDHVFLPGFSQPGIRGDYSKMEEYIQSVRDLREKYKDQIEIHLGFECEYSPLLKDYYTYLKKELGIEYLILGQHLFFETLSDVTWVAWYNDKEEMLKRYTDTVIEAMGSGLFTYFAHPDLFMRFCEKYEPFMEPYFRKICECAKKYDIPLEINLGRLRDIKCSHRPGGVYPCEEFFKIVSEYQNKVIIGVDAHSPNDFDSSMTDFEYAEELIRKYNLPAINRIKF